MPLRRETRICVRSECTLCGAFSVGSMMDHSIQNWEKAHTCKRESEKGKANRPLQTRQEKSGWRIVKLPP